MFTENQIEILKMNDGYVEVLSRALWDGNQEANYDPMHPVWEHLDDPIKESYRNAASIAVLVNNGEDISVDLNRHKECIGQLISLLESGFDSNNYYHTDSIDDAKRLLK